MGLPLPIVMAGLGPPLILQALQTAACFIDHGLRRVFDKNRHLQVFADGGRVGAGKCTIQVRVGWLTDLSILQKMHFVP